MPHWLDPRIALVVLALAAILLAVGVRGVRVDRDPRCRARRCRYPLRELLDARRRANEPEWPLTCPECGRVMESESRARRGARKKLRPLIALGIVLAAPSVGLLGFEGYTRWQSARAVTVMPLWLLLRQAESDTRANNWVHQQEILERARAGAITGKDATRVIERMLKWAEDPSVMIGYAADVIPMLAAKGFATEDQVERLWERFWVFELILPDEVEDGEIIPFEVVGHYRGTSRYAPTGDPVPLDSPPVDVVVRVGTRVRVIRLALDDKASGLPPTELALFGGGPVQQSVAWFPNLRTTDRDAFPRAAGEGRSLRFEVNIEAHLAHTPQYRKVSHPVTGQTISIEDWLRSLGAPQAWRVKLRGETRVVPKGSIVARTSRDAAWEEWYRNHVRGATLLIEGERELSASVILARGGPDARPGDAIRLYADQHLRWNGWTTPLAPIDADIPFLQSTGGALLDRTLGLPVAHWAMAYPDGWELVITPRPERSLLNVRRPVAWAGDPLVIPLRVMVSGRCWNPPAPPPNEHIPNPGSQP